MKTTLFLISFTLLIALDFGRATYLHSVEGRIRRSALRDGIDLDILDVASEALASIAEVYRSNRDNYSQFPTKRDVVEEPGVSLGRRLGNIVDVHSHVIPDWYRRISPFIGGLHTGTPTPAWNVTSHFKFMDTIGISHSIVGFTGPSANVYLGDQKGTVALARLINEYLAALSRTFPTKFSFFASIPLPYTSESIRELRYAMHDLGAVGVALMSNHEGHYLGYDAFTPFWRAMDGLGGRPIAYVHPTTPYIRLNDTYFPANPYFGTSQSRMEFYMETARTFVDLTITQTIHSFTNTHFILPHVGGAFPTMIDRVLRTVKPELYNSSLEIYCTRFWWDSAGPTYYHQIDGLLGYGIPKTNLLYGSDYPFVETAATADYLEAVMNYPGLTEVEKDDLLSKNYKRLFIDN